MMVKNWVLTVTVQRPFDGKQNLRHYLNGFTHEQAASLSSALVAKHDGFVVGVSLAENRVGGDNKIAD